MAPAPRFLDHRGSPMLPVARGRSGGIRASLAGGGYVGNAGLNQNAFPYDAAALNSAEMEGWYPWVRSPDSEINQYRDRMVARQRDLHRNDGWASGLIATILDSTVGPYYRLVAKPDHRALARRFGPKFDLQWATEFRSAAEAIWRTYADDPGHYNDVTRQLTVTQQLRLALGHKLVDGEGLLVRYWLPERLGRGAARYAQATMVVDPDRLSNPMQQQDTRFLRGGVEIDAYGVPLAYNIRKAHQNDWYSSVESMQWERVVREDEDGFLRVIHDYDRGRAGQNRGVSIFAPVLTRMKMLARYYGVKLQSEAIATVFGFAIKSPYDRQMIEEALSAGDEDDDAIGLYANMREGFHERNAMTLGDSRIPLLAPGEEFTTIASERPPGEMTPFAHEMLRSFAAAAGVSGEQVTKDYSEANFSSMRVGIVDSERTCRRRVADFNTNTASPLYAGVLHEAMDAGDLDDVLPSGASEFIDARAEYSRCRWLGAARGWYDPVAERQGAVLGLDAGFDTLEDVAAEQGLDWEETVEQRATEVALFKKHGLPLAQWMGPDKTAQETSAKPEPK